MFEELSSFYSPELLPVLVPIFKQKFEDDSYQVTDPSKSEARLVELLVEHASEDDLFNHAADLIRFIRLCAQNIEPEVNKVYYSFLLLCISI